MLCTFDRFQRIAQDAANRYFTQIHTALSDGSMRLSPGCVCLYPSIILFTETDTHYVVEFLGAQRRYRDVRVKRHRQPSFNQVLASFNFDRPVVYLLGTGDSRKTNLELVLEGFACLNSRLIDKMNSRYPRLREMFNSLMASDLSGWFADNPGAEAYASVDGECIDNTLVIKNCVLSSTLGETVRVRHTNFLLAVSRRLDADEVAATVADHLTIRRITNERLAGVQIVPEGSQERIILSAQFSNLFLQKTKEVTLSQFLEDHTDALKAALKAELIWFQARLPWREGNDDSGEQYIQPDIIIRRYDGIWQIIDLRLPLITRTSITKGAHKRRRFIDDAYEGISQLANYAQYFEFPANREAAEQILGTMPESSPATVLIVGNVENVREAEVLQAKRSHSEVEIMSFDTLANLISGIGA